MLDKTKITHVKKRPEIYAKLLKIHYIINKYNILSFFSLVI